MRINELRGNLILASQCGTKKEYLAKKEIEVYDETNPAHVVLVKIWELSHDLTFKKLRQVSGLTQAKFAQEYGVPLRTLEKWDTGERTPPPYVIELLAAGVITNLAESAESEEEKLH